MRDQGPSNQVEIVRATGIDQATIRGIVDRLKRRDLVDFLSDTKDRRKVVVTLTPAGEAVLDAMIPCAWRISELTMGGLTPVERVAIMHVLRKMIGFA